MLAIFDCNWI